MCSVPYCPELSLPFPLPAGVSVLYEGRLELLPPGDHKALRKFEMLPRYFNFFIQEIRHEEFPFLSSPQKYKLGELIIISPDFTTKGHFEKVVEEKQKEAEREEEEGGQGRRGQGREGNGTQFFIGMGVWKELRRVGEEVL